MSFLNKIVMFLIILIISISLVYGAQWQQTPPKRDMYDVEVQLCINPSQCLVTSSGNIDYDNDPEKYYKATTFLERPRCLADGQYVEDFYCATGEWTSRTKLLSDAIYGVALNRNHGENNFTMVCGPYDYVLNDFATAYGDASKVKQFLEKNCNHPFGCINNICVLKFPKGVVLGTSLNIPVNNTNSFLVELNFSQFACDNVPPFSYGGYGTTQSNFQECSGTPSSSTFYDSGLNSLLYDPTGLKVFPAPLQQFHWNVIENLFLDNINQYTLDYAHDQNAPVLGRNFTLLPKARYFRNVFFYSNGDSSIGFPYNDVKLVYSFFEDDQQNFDYFGIKTQNVTWPQGVCNIIESSDPRAVVYCKNNTFNPMYYVVGKKPTQGMLSDVWNGLTKLLRIV